MLMEKTRPTRSTKPAVLQHGLPTEFVLITPDIARAWLDKNKKNRNVAAGTVGAYARDMKAGKWLLTGDAIRFDKDGNLIDGQHRLRACIEAETPFPSLVIYSLGRDVQEQVDTGKPRKINDLLTLHGFHYTTRLAATARIIFYMAHHEDMRQHRTKPTHSEIMAIIKKHPLIHHSVAVCLSTAGAPQSMLAFIHYVGAAMLDKEKRADAFVEVFETGVPDYDGDPAQKVREKLLRQSEERTVLKRDHTSRLLIHAWNAFVKKKPVDLLRAPKETTIDGLDISKL